MGRKKRDEEGVSLFPFMSILACLIGILTLMISVSMAAKQQKEGLTQEEFERAKENDRLKKQVAQMAAEIKKIEQSSTKEQAAAIELRKLVLQQNTLADKLKQMEVPEENKDAELQQIIEMMKKETQSIREEQPVFQKRIEELRAELEKRKIQPKPAESVKIKPGGSAKALGRKLMFVECNSTGIVIRDPGKDPVIISTAAIKDSVEYAEFCHRASEVRGGQVLFLMRKAGFDAYRWAAGIAEANYELTTGKLPIPNDGEIDLSLFQ